MSLYFLGMFCFISFVGLLTFIKFMCHKMLTEFVSYIERGSTRSVETGVDKTVVYLNYLWHNSQHTKLFM